VEFGNQEFEHIIIITMITMITIDFTLEEMRKYLLNTGIYEIGIVKYTQAYTEYSNRILNTDKEMEIAYPKDIPLDNFINGKEYLQLSKWSIPTVFKREIKNKILNL
jgi:hypothetical protein